MLFVPKLEMIIEEIHKDIRVAQESINVLASVKVRQELSPEGKYFEKALKKGVKMTMILEKPCKGKRIPTNTQELTRYSNFVIRYVPKTPKVEFVIEDNKKVWIKTSNDMWHKSSCMIINNEIIIALVRDYSDKILENAYLSSELNDVSCKKMSVTKHKTSKGLQT